MLAPFTQPWLWAITGPPKSGKSGEVISQYRQYLSGGLSGKCGFLVAKHPLEDKDCKGITSINRNAVLDAVVAESLQVIASHVTERTKYVAICGANFFEDAAIVDLCSELRASGRNVILTGINRTYEDKPYGHIGALLAIADRHDAKHALCSGCGKPANRSEEKNGAVPKCLMHYHGEGRADHKYFLTDQQGSFHVISGPMFGNKTETLGEIVTQARMARIPHVMFKWSKDERYNAASITSHDKRDLGEAVCVSEGSNIIDYLDNHPGIRHVFIDEMQFLPGIHDAVQRLLYQGYAVTGTLLPREFRCLPFGESPQLLTLADSTQYRSALCVKCQHPANETQRVVVKDGQRVPAPWKDDTLQVGGAEAYEARCRACHDVPGKPEPKFNIVEMHPT
ncbi:hypothetical protein HY642_03165 [Candidatus Woesearchaeota archaeon]|nr:hypothetical protein [Candidatus Woesearchaeota archaeon]